MFRRPRQLVELGVFEWNQNVIHGGSPLLAGNTAKDKALQL
jgi:hypothetical protein